MNYNRNQLRIIYDKSFFSCSVKNATLHGVPHSPMKIPHYHLYSVGMQLYSRKRNFYHVPCFHDFIVNDDFLKQTRIAKCQ